jgi:hypothetical protein
MAGTLPQKLPISSPVCSRTFLSITVTAKIAKQAQDGNVIFENPMLSRPLRSIIMPLNVLHCYP